MPRVRFDDLTAAAAHRTRREVLALVGRGLAASVVSSAGLGAFWPAAAAQEDCVIEYPPADLDNCPNRRHHPGHTPSTNGCGPQGWKGYLVSNSGYFFKADFMPGCDEHDRCYGTCNSDKAACDHALGRASIEACKASYTIAQQLTRAACITMARNYEAAVSKLGDDPYHSGQTEDCECCRPRTFAFCNCNKKCYLTAARCTEECKANLGCFTAICRPSLPGECG